MDIGKVIRELEVAADEELLPTREKPMPDEKVPHPPAPAEPAGVPA